MSTHHKNCNVFSERKLDEPLLSSDKNSTENYLLKWNNITESKGNHSDSKRIISSKTYTEIDYINSTESTKVTISQDDTGISLRSYIFNQILSLKVI